MKKLPVVITAATCFAAFHLISPLIGAPAAIIVVLFVLSHFIVLYMAYVILKYGIPSEDKFEDKFYEDSPYRRNRPINPPVRGEEKSWE
jgi:hypothetical protein